MAEHHHHGHIHDAHLEEDQTAPDFTSPQGTQVSGDVPGYEATDVNIASLIPWVIGLGVSVVVVMVLTGAAFVLLEQRERARHVLPSPIFQAQTPPPEPRLLPNPVDSPPEAATPLVGPGDYARFYHEQEEADLAALGLFDPAARRMTIPPAILDRVTTAPDTALTEPDVHRIDGLTLPMPSASSGGTRLENRLR